MKRMNAVFFSQLVLTFGLSANAITLAQAKSAAQAAGFETESILKLKSPFTVRKTGTRVETVEFIAYAANPTTASAFASASTDLGQLTLNCNQCQSKKLTEAIAMTCYEDVDKISRVLKIDLPVGVIRTFENLKTNQQSWALADRKYKSVRYTKTLSKCKTGAGAESIRFDFFFK